jgi:two-component system, NarL family, sensor histidine kinase DegS
MKRKMSVLSRQYEAALGEYLKSRSNSGLKKAGALGTEAVSLGLETLDLAKMHEQALIEIGASNSAGSRDGLAKRAQTFFVEANFSIERTHLAAAKADLHWTKLNERLHERTSELAISKRDVKTNMAQRKAAEESLRTKNEYYGKLLKESKSMQESLRSLTHRVLSAQESERGKISRELHDEIAQILLGINVRLLTLQQKGSLDAEKLLKDIASTQQIVDKSIQTMRRAARKFHTPHEK